MIGSRLYRHGPIILVIPQSSSRLFFLHHMAPYRWGFEDVSDRVVSSSYLPCCSPDYRGTDGPSSLLANSFCMFLFTQREKRNFCQRFLTHTHKSKTTIEFGLAGPRKRAALSLYIDWTKVWNFLLPASQTRLTPSSFLSLSLYTRQ